MLYNNGICVQALCVLMALSLARDEFHWLLRHADNVPQKKPNAKASNEDFVDRFTCSHNIQL